jgi:hypothetical protein
MYDIKLYAYSNGDNIYKRQVFGGLIEFLVLQLLMKYVLLILSCNFCVFILESEKDW